MRMANFEPKDFVDKEKTLCSKERRLRNRRQYQRTHSTRWYRAQAYLAHPYHGR